MGRVYCRVHGATVGGSMACDHVRDGVHARTRGLLDCSKVLWDFFGDGSVTFELLLCSRCIHAFRVNTEEVQPAEKALPDVCPTCRLCEDAFHGLRRRAAC
jgi:hypothetical protein